MDRLHGDRTVSFQANRARTPPGTTTTFNRRPNSNQNLNVKIGNNSVGNYSNDASKRLSSTVAPGYAQLSPSTGNLWQHRVASHQLLHGGSTPSLQAASRGSGGGRSDSSFEALMGTSPPQRLEEPLASLFSQQQQQQHSGESAIEVGLTASPMGQSSVGGYVGSGALPATLSRDSTTMQELMALQQQQQQHQQSQQKGVTVIYPQRASPTEGQTRMPDYANVVDVVSNSEDSANEDRVQVRVEGYYESANMNVLIPNDLPPSTFLYVLTASDGRDLMFKLTQYSLQLIICFLKMPSLFSPEVQAFTGPWAERLYRNYNTIRHGRSLFKVGRGLLNIFTVQTVCERMWMKYENTISRHTCAALLPVVTRVEKVLLMLGVSPVWGRAISRQLLHWSQTVELTPGQRRLEDMQDSMAMDWRIQARMKEKQDTVYPGALLADDTFMHITDVERGTHNCTNNAGRSKGDSKNDSKNSFANNSSGLLQGMASASFTDMAISTAMNAMGFSVRRGTAYPRGTASLLPSQPVPPRSPMDEEKSSLEFSHNASPRAVHESFPTETPTSLKSGGAVVGTAQAPMNSHDTTASDTSTNHDRSGFDEKAVGTTTAAYFADQHIETTANSSADDSPGMKGRVQLPPFMYGTTPQFMEHDRMPGMTPSKLTTADTEPTIDPFKEDGGEAGGGRVTLLRPLPRPTQHSTAADVDLSITGDEAYGMRLGNNTTQEEMASMLTAAPAHSSKEAMSMSMPDSWRPAMAPTVPPSQSDDFLYGRPMCSSDAAGSSPSTPALPRVTSSSHFPPPTSKNSEKGGRGDASLAKVQVDSEDGETAKTTKAAAAAAVAVADAKDSGVSQEKDAASHESQRMSEKKYLPLPADLAVPLAQVGSVSHITSPSSSLSAMPARRYKEEEELNESEMSILTSKANSSFHVRPVGSGGVLTAWLNELQPASAALPARVRKGVLQFNPILMTLLGIRNLAAAFRRFLRDATLISTERFTTFTFIEAHRPAITRFVNRCWLVISIIDLLLNTVRLLQPGWAKYATARQNIRCRCGCQGDDDPADTVWRTHGFIARRKTDLFFPPLNLDYGAPIVSGISYMEAADPTRLTPACSRCGCLYKELPSEAAIGDGEEDVAATMAPSGPGSLSAGNPVLSRSAPAHAALPSETPPLVSLVRLSQMVSDEGEHSLSLGAVEREKPRWVQMYEAEVRDAEELKRRGTAKTANSHNNNGNVVATDVIVSSGAGKGGIGGRRGTQKPSTSAAAANGLVEVEDPPRKGSQELVGVVTPPPLTATAGGRPLHPLVKRETRDDFIGETASSEGGSERGSTTGILFVPWMMRKLFDYVWLLRVHPNLTATILLEARYLAEFYLSYKYCFGNYETNKADAPLNAILHPYGAIAGMVSAAVGLLRVVESAPAS